MTSRYVKRASFLVSGVMIGAVVSTQYRLDDHHTHHRRSCAPSSSHGAGNGPLAVKTWKELAEYLVVPLEVRRRWIYESFFGHPAGPCRGGDGSGDGGDAEGRVGRDSAVSAVAHAQSQPMGEAVAPTTSSSSAATHKALPSDIKTRFLLYARRDPQTGEYVQQFDDFIACLLLLEPFSLSSPMKEEGCCVADGQLPAGGRGKVVLPPLVEKRVAKFFSLVDMDQSKTVNYAEFVVIFTLLSTQQRMLRTAFSVFQHGNNAGRVNELEFTRLLNTLMVDPSVQITYDGKAKDGRQSQPSPAAATAAAAAAASPSSSPTPTSSSAAAGSESPHVAPFLEADASAPLDLARSLASQTRRARRSRSQGKGSLTFTMPSSTVWRLFREAPPQHELAPPGSMHNASNPFNWKHREQVKHLKQLSDDDARMNLLSFDVFWYRMDFLRWELRAIEFGLFDPENTGLISLQEFRYILAHDLEKSLADKQVKKVAHGSGGDTAAKVREGTKGPEVPPEGGGNAPTKWYFNFGARQKGAIPAALTTEAVPSLRHTDEHARTVSWQFYQTVFDIIRESDVTLPALRLALDAEPPVPASQLVAGAIPDVAKEASHRNVKDLVVQRQEGSDDAVANARSQQMSLVRPTALTWKQFGQVLKACPSVPQLTQEEQQLFFELFDADRSGTITPEEFSQLCELKRTFFAMYMPRFHEPRRNTVQQFVFCMQQLE